jgi:hypothetical protein
MYSDDLAPLDAGTVLYDFYRWCGDAAEETHTGHSKKLGPEMSEALGEER